MDIDLPNQDPNGRPLEIEEEIERIAELPLVERTDALEKLVSALEAGFEVEASDTEG